MSTHAGLWYLPCVNCTLQELESFSIIVSLKKKKESLEFVKMSHCASMMKSISRKNCPMFILSWCNVDCCTHLQSVWTLMLGRRKILKPEPISNPCYFVIKNVLTYCEKELFYWLIKTFEIRGWRPRICKNFEITRPIYSNSKRSEQFLVTECFFNLFLEVSQI